MNSRRAFVGCLVAILLSLTTDQTTKGAEERTRKKASAGGLPLADPKTDPVAKNLNYVHDKKEIKDADLKVPRSGVAFEQQFCKNCQFYPDKDAPQGPCQIIPGKSVKASGWCKSWAKRQG